MEYNHSQDMGLQVQDTGHSLHPQQDMELVVCKIFAKLNQEAIDIHVTIDTVPVSRD